MLNILSRILIYQTQTTMKPVQIDGLDFDIVIIDDSIQLQSITKDIIIEDGYTLLKDEARNLWTKNGRGFGPADFISQYVDDNIEQWVMNNLELGKVVTYNLN